MVLATAPTVSRAVVAPTASVGGASAYMTQATVGELVRRYRKMRGLTQEELAAAINSDKSYVGRLESNPKQRPSLEVLRRIATALNVPVGSLTRALGYVPVEEVDAESKGFDTWEQVEKAIMDAENLDDAQKNGLILVLKPAVTTMLAEGAAKYGERRPKKGRAAS